MRTPIRYAAASAAVIAASTGLAGLAGPAHAAQSTQTLSCGGQELTVRAPRAIPFAPSQAKQRLLTRIYRDLSYVP